MKRICIRFYMCVILLFATLTSHSQSTDISGKNGVYQLTFANIFLEVNSKIGARISSLNIDNHQILFTNQKSNNWGSTIWPSPQAIWNWPPPGNIDNKPYHVSIADESIRLTSDVDKITQLSVSKTITANKADTSIQIVYTLINQSKSHQQYAPWEITRVPSQGIVYYQKDANSDSLNSTNLDEPCNEKRKIICDGTGWQAYVNPDNYVFIKTYNNITPEQTAPKEGEFELYRDFNNYVELENQGKYETMAPGDSLTWKVTWYLRKLPANIALTTNNQNLKKYIFRFIKNK